MLFNRLFGRRTELEVDAYVLQNEQSTPLLLDAKLSVYRNEVTICNQVNKFVFNEDNIHDFKYHEMDMCQFKYMKNGIVQEYGFVFSDMSNMYYFYKYMMLSYIKGNIILHRSVHLYKYNEPVKVPYRRNYFGVLVFNTAKCEHLLIVVKSNRRERHHVDDSSEVTMSKDIGKYKNGTSIQNSRKEVIDLESEKYYEQFSIENLRELYKRNKVFLIYILNTFNDIYLSKESIGVNLHKYIVSNMFRFVPYKTLYPDGDAYRGYFIGEEAEMADMTDVEDAANAAQHEFRGRDNSAEHMEDYELASLDRKLNEDRENCQWKREFSNGEYCSRNREKYSYMSEEDYTIGRSYGRGKNEENNSSLEINKLSEKFLIIIESEGILIDYIKNILVYRYDFKNDIVHIKQDYIDTNAMDGKGCSPYLCVEGEKGENENRTENKGEHRVIISDSDVSEEVDVSDGEDNSDMKYKHVNTNGKFSFVLRQNYMPPKGKRNMSRKQTGSGKGDTTGLEQSKYRQVDYNGVSNDLSIYKFDEFGKEKKIYTSHQNMFKYKNEKCIPRSAHINDEEGNTLILLDEKDEKNLFMIDVNREKIVQKWEMNYMPISKLLRKEENVYCGYNKNSLYYLDTRMKSCLQNVLQYGKGTSPIEHASMDDNGRIILTNTQGELKYYDGKLNKSNVIKRSKNSLFCAKDIVHLTVSSDGFYSVVTCEKSVILCENVIDKNNLFDKIIKKNDRLKQKKILLQIHYVDVFTYNLGNYVFVKSAINHDNTFVFTISHNFYVVWDFKEAINDHISYIIKKVNENISDISFFTINDIEGIIMATENSLKSKKIRRV
ncbi:conserved Plasmodium protein, unknown function [Plasmodium ovale]|uniref:Vacuolar import/degradation Vid27 C-terminal domain-containing protein n=2 Tax=Plasmodium ovale TaxID=36330 RepID=A0A1A8W7I5_PLAOA|nr:conserved Plasmodium protein, unknown function [Plasmodium ovale curtisi]SBS98514.1 conserved Plasmodium protein, unknown function [Plasmodium ovale curtisi]SCQ17173.1 conserved Plasmodium protein, unknown function [Plasmodium ovale]